MGQQLHELPFDMINMWTIISQDNNEKTKDFQLNTNPSYMLTGQKKTLEIQPK